MSDDLVKRFEHLGKAADLLKSQAAEIARLRAEAATAKREGMEEAARIALAMSISSPSVIAAAIRAAAKEGKP